MKRKIYWVGEVAGAHVLILPYDSKCRRLHGHNWKVEVEIEAHRLVNGMILDYSVIKRIVKELDHKTIVPERVVARVVDKWVYIDVNEKHLEIPKDEVVVIQYENVTAECMAEYIARRIYEELMSSEWDYGKVEKVVVRVWEDERSYAEVELDG